MCRTTTFTGFPPKEVDAADRTGDTITMDTRTAMMGCHEADTGEEGEDQVEDLEEALVGQSQDDWADVSQHAKTGSGKPSHGSRGSARGAFCGI